MHSPPLLPPSSSRPPATTTFLPLPPLPPLCNCRHFCRSLAAATFAATTFAAATIAAAKPLTKPLLPAPTAFAAANHCCRLQALHFETLLKWKQSSLSHKFLINVWIVAS